MQYLDGIFQKNVSNVLLKYFVNLIGIFLVFWNFCNISNMPYNFAKIHKEHSVKIFYKYSWRIKKNYSLLIENKYLFIAYYDNKTVENLRCNILLEYFFRIEYWKYSKSILYPQEYYNFTIFLKLFLEYL